MFGDWLTSKLVARWVSCFTIIVVSCSEQIKNHSFIYFFCFFLYLWTTRCPLFKFSKYGKPIPEVQTIWPARYIIVNSGIFTKRLWPISCGRYRHVAVMDFASGRFGFCVANLVVGDMVCGRYRCNSRSLNRRQFLRRCVASCRTILTTWVSRGWVTLDNL